MPEDPFVLLEVKNRIATLTMNRPQSRNSLGLSMLQALEKALAEVAADPGVAVVVMAGAGPGFCAGHDLKEMRTRAFDHAYGEALFGLCGKVMQAIVAMPKPVIARVQGVATAAGCQLVATCDLAIAESGSRFATPGVNIGLFCSTPGVALARTLSSKHAMQLLLTGEMIDAPTALRIGLINEIVAPAELEGRVAALAEKLAGKSAAVLALGKRTFYAQAEMGLAAAYDFAGAAMADNLTLADTAEGISAFLDKRPPAWRHG